MGNKAGWDLQENKKFWSRYYTEVSAERTHSKIRNLAWVSFSCFLFQACWYLQENKKLWSRYYTEVSVERIHFQIIHAWTSSSVSYLVSWGAPEGVGKPLRWHASTASNSPGHGRASRSRGMRRWGRHYRVYLVLLYLSPRKVVATSIGQIIRFPLHGNYRYFKRKLNIRGKIFRVLLPDHFDAHLFFYTRQIATQCRWLGRFGTKCVKIQRLFPSF